MKLLPCPFCGGKGKLKGDESAYGCFVECIDCHAEMDYSETKEEAVEAWNKRVVLPDCESAEKQGDKCLGYGKSEYDDEPCDICKVCSNQSSYGAI